MPALERTLKYEINSKKVFQIPIDFSKGIGREANFRYF